MSELITTNAASETSMCKCIEWSGSIPSVLGRRLGHNKHDAHWAKKKDLRSVCSVHSSREALSPHINPVK